LGTTASTLSFQARSTLTKGSASGLIGNYQVDRHTGRVWQGAGDRKDEVRSYLVENLRQQLLSAPQGPLAELSIRSENFLQNIKQSNSAIGYSLWGVTVGTRLDPTRLASGVRADALTPNARIGQMLSGFRLVQTGNTKAPQIEIYKGANDSIVEIYVEVAVERESFDELFGKAFTDAVLSTDVEKWKAVFGAETMIRRGRFNNVEAFFIDAPSKGFSACSYTRMVAGGLVYVDPIFVDFYIPGQAAKGELLEESAARRVVSCLRDRAVLDAP
jgi:hypothetical protein